jgi:uncharacterized membrane protein (UPF0127 family)
MTLLMNFDMRVTAPRRVLRVRRMFRLLFAAAVVSGFALHCASGRLQSTELSIERSGVQPITIKAELARTQEERSQGLMRRTYLADGRGMLFIFDRDQILSFWMKNTLIPLSIAFIAADGRIIEIKDMQPHDLSSVVSSRSVRYALEVPQGWFDRAGVRTGDIVNLKGIAGRN